MQEFSPRAAENLPLWQHVSLQAFPEELRRQAAQEVAAAGAAQTRGWLAGSRTAAELTWLASDLLDGWGSLHGARQSPCWVPEGLGAVGAASASGSGSQRPLRAAGQPLPSCLAGHRPCVQTSPSLCGPSF